MDIFVLPIDLTNLKINDANAHAVHYTLNYFKAADCINKLPSSNCALELVRKNNGIGDKSDSIYEKFVPIGNANLLQERKDLGFEFNVMDYDYPGYYVTSEVVYRKWQDRIRLEQKVDYKIRSLIDLHGISPGAIEALMIDCDQIPFDTRAQYQLGLMSDIWDSNYYAIFDDNIVWGVGYSEIGAFFNALENHAWLTSFMENLEPEIKAAQNFQPYDDPLQIFGDIIEGIMQGHSRFFTGNNLMIQPCTKALFSVVSQRGLSEFDFAEQGGRLSLATGRES